MLIVQPYERKAFSDKERYEKEKKDYLRRKAAAVTSRALQEASAFSSLSAPQSSGSLLPLSVFPSNTTQETKLSYLPFNPYSGAAVTASTVVHTVTTQSNPAN